MTTVEDLRRALAPVDAAMTADGYALDCSMGSDGVVEVQLRTVSEDACADCLVPEPVLGPLLTSLLGDAGITAQVVIRYPSAHQKPTWEGG